MSADAPTERQLQVLLEYTRLHSHEAVAEKLGIALRLRKRSAR